MAESRRRLGKLCIDEAHLTHRWPLIQKIFAYIRFLPIETDRHYDTMAVTYLGWSPYFAEVPIGSVAPIYSISWSMDDDEHIVDVQINGKSIKEVGKGFDKNQIFW